MFKKRGRRWAFLSVALVTVMATAGMAQTEIRQKITDQGLLKAIASGENIYQKDSRAERVQFKREKDWTIFFAEANRAHARLGASQDEAVQSEAYLYLVPFYRALTNQEFHEAFLQEFPSLQPFDISEALQVSLLTAKEGVIDTEKALAQLQLLIEWYETLSQSYNLAAEGDIDSEWPQAEQVDFANAVNNLTGELSARTPKGEAGIFAAHLRALGLNYGLSDKAKQSDSIIGIQQLNQVLHTALVQYALAVSVRPELTYAEKMAAFSEAATALLDLRKVRGLDESLALEKEFTTAVDRVGQERETGTALEQLGKQLQYIFVRENIAPELWLGKVLPPTDKQEEPKPYKIALESYRRIAEEAQQLLDSGTLSAEEALEAELVALEAQSWVCQLVQDKGIVFSSDFNFEQAAVERDILLAIRQRVENNPLQTSKRAFDLAQKARLHEIEFYQYQYKPEALQKSIELITHYAPQVLPPLNETIPAPEGRFDVRCGVGMLVWMAEAYDQLEEFDEAEAIFTKIRELYGDRYRYPDPWCFSFDGFAKQYLDNIPNKRAQKIAKEGGVR